MEQPTEPAGDIGAIATLKISRFTTYLLINLLSMVGKWGQRIAVGWHVWQISGSEAVLGVIGGAELIPAIVLGPLAGVLADRIRPMKMVLVCCLIGIAQAILLGVSIMADFATLPLIFAMMLSSGIANGAMEPARAAMILTLVPKRALPSAVTLDSLVFNSARFAGPALAGVLLLALTPATLVLLNAAGTVPMILILLWLARRGRLAEEPRPATKAGNILQEMRNGFVYIARHPRIAPVVCLLAGMSFFLRPLSDMLPPFVARIPNGGTSELALLVSAFGAGALASGLAITFGRGQSRLQTWLMTAMVATTLSTLAFLYSENLALSFAMAAIAGAGQSTIGIASKTIMQMVCDPGFRGRVVSVYSMLYLGAPALGLPFIGALAELIELRLAFLFGIAACTVMIGIMLARRTLSR